MAEHPDLDALKARLRALLAMTVDNGCTEAEALAAAAKAQEMLSRHGLDAAELETPDHDETLVDLAARRTPVDELWPVLGYFCNCRYWLQRDRDAGRWTAVYFGRAADVAVAEYLHVILARAVAQAIAGYKQSDNYRRRRKYKRRREALRAYAEGMVERLQERLASLKWQRCDVGDDRRTGQLVRAYQAELDVALERRGMSFSAVVPIRKAGLDTRWDRTAGRFAANAVDLNRGIAGAQGGDAALLTSGSKAA